MLKQAALEELAGWVEVSQLAAVPFLVELDLEDRSLADLGHVAAAVATLPLG